MAQFGFGLNINETAQETGYDQYQTSLFESLGAVAADNWNFNPVISLLTFKDIQSARAESRTLEKIPRNKNELNEELLKEMRVRDLNEASKIVNKDDFYAFINAGNNIIRDMEVADKSKSEAKKYLAYLVKHNIM